MKISLDAGALCTRENLRFGNYWFTRNLIETIYVLDRKNEYFIYSFCKKPDWLKIGRQFHFNMLKPTMLWLSTRVSLEEIRVKKDIFLALNQAIPLKTRSKVIAFSHGLSFYFYPQFYPDSYYSLKDELEPMVKKSRYIVVSSLRVKMELKKLYPNCTNIVVINYGVPFDMLDEKSKVSTKGRSPSGRKSQKSNKYFLFVGMDHPIKNIEFLLNVFKRFRKKNGFEQYKLFLVGNLGRFEDKKNNVYTFAGIDRSQLRKLYRDSTAYLTSSYYESFNIPVLEALAQNCPVIGLAGAIMPEVREYVSVAYDTDDFIEQMIKGASGRNVKSDRNVVIKKFSWKKYVTKLMELYEA